MQISIIPSILDLLVNNHSIKLLLNKFHYYQSDQCYTTILIVKFEIFKQVYKCINHSPVTEQPNFFIRLTNNVGLRYVKCLQ